MGNCLKSHSAGLANKTPDITRGRLGIKSIERTAYRFTDKAYIKSDDEDGERSSFVEHPQLPKSKRA
jgi:hypothetical protein